MSCEINHRTHSKSIKKLIMINKILNNIIMKLTYLLILLLTNDYKFFSD